MDASNYSNSILILDIARINRMNIETVPILKRVLANKAKIYPPVKYFVKRSFSLRTDVRQHFILNLF